MRLAVQVPMIMSDYPPIHTKRRWLGVVLGGIIAAVALGALIQILDWRAALQTLRHVQRAWLSLALALLLGNNIAKAQRWRLLFPSTQPAPSLRETLGALMAGQLLNFTISFRSGDLSRAYFLGRHRGSSTATAVGTIGAEKLLDLVVIGGLFAVIMPYFTLPTWLEANKTAIWLISLGALGVWIAIVFTLPRWRQTIKSLAEHWPKATALSRMIDRLLSGFSALRQRHRLFPVILWTLLAWLCSIAATYALLASLSLSASLSLAILANVIVQGGLSVPLAPAHIGIFEWLAILALSIANIPPAQGLAYGLLTHAAVLLFPLLIGTPWLLTRPVVVKPRD